MTSTYNPASVMMGSAGGRNTPYLPAKPPQAKQQTPASTTIGPQSVRAIGSGPFDAAYRQNLATYAGGLFNRPGGNLSFNPTDASSFPGQATGGGNAPLLGMPNTLASQAIGGQPFSWAPPTTTNSGDLSQQGTNQWWLKQYMGQGNLFGLPGMIAQRNNNG